MSAFSPLWGKSRHQSVSCSNDYTALAGAHLRPDLRPQRVDRHQALVGLQGQKARPLHASSPCASAPERPGVEHFPDKMLRPGGRPYSTSCTKDVPMPRAPVPAQLLLKVELPLKLIVSATSCVHMAAPPVEVPPLKVTFWFGK